MVHVLARKAMSPWIVMQVTFWLGLTTTSSTAFIIPSTRPLHNKAISTSVTPSTTAVVANRWPLFMSSSPLPSAPSSTTTTTKIVPTLDQRTRWKIQVTLKTPGGKEVEADIIMRFVQKQGYEPPQGIIFVERDSAGLLQVDEKGFAQGTWALSEDRNDRKWGLWIWGLFEEPLYPYLYFSLGVADQPVMKEEGQVEMPPAAWIPNKRLDFRFNHVRQEGAVVLGKGIMSYKTVEMVDADPLGLGGKINAGEVMDAGTVDIYPLL